jgi:hypothetical protein
VNLGLNAAKALPAIKFSVADPFTWLRMRKLMDHGSHQNYAGNMDVLIAWPRSGGLPEGDREERLKTDE